MLELTSERSCSYSSAKGPVDDPAQGEVHALIPHLVVLQSRGLCPLVRLMCCAVGHDKGSVAGGEGLDRQDAADRVVVVSVSKVEGALQGRVAHDKAMLGAGYRFLRVCCKGCFGPSCEEWQGQWLWP